MNPQTFEVIMRYVAVIVLIAFVLFSIKRAGGPLKAFSNLTELVNGAEGAWLNFAAAIIPYGVSLIPASLTYQHVISELSFTPLMALDAGVVIELFGVVAMQTLIRFWQNNKKYTSEKSENRAPLGLAVFAYAFYLAIVLIVNVVLEIMAGSRSFWGIVAIGLFSLLGIPSGILIAIRSQHREIIENRKSGTKPGFTVTPKYTPRPRNASDFKADMITMLDNEYRSKGRVMELTEITAKLKLDHNNSKGFVSTVRSGWMSENNIPKKQSKNPLEY